MRPRDRIVRMARELFRKHGIRGVGVDTIAEKAGTNKMTLYRHFHSKDELVIACLRDFENDVETLWQSLEKSYPGDPLAQLHGWVRIAADYALGDMRGCEMANVAIELAEDQHPARHVIEEFKTRQRDRLVRLCRKAGIAKADQLADTLSLLIEGARVSVQSVGPEGPGARFIAIAEAVIAVFAQGRAAKPEPHRLPRTRKSAAGSAV